MDDEIVSGGLRLLTPSADVLVPLHSVDVSLEMFAEGFEFVKDEFAASPLAANLFDLG